MTFYEIFWDIYHLTQSSYLEHCKPCPFKRLVGIHLHLTCPDKGLELSESSTGLMSPLWHMGEHGASVTPDWSGAGTARLSPQGMRGAVTGKVGCGVSQSLPRSSHLGAVNLGDPQEARDGDSRHHLRGLLWLRMVIFYGKPTPPKKKAGNKAAKGKTPTVVDGLSTEEMSKEQELDREREERNYFQLERDKIHTFWEITKRQLEEKKADLRNRDREMEESEERHQVEIKVYKQKVKHLLYEHQNNISELKAEGVVATKLLQQEQNQQENELRRTMRTLKVDLKEQDLSNENLIRSLKLKHDEEMTKMRKDFERQVRDIEAKYEKKMQMLRQELDLRRKTEIHETEERKNSHINTLIKNHEKAFMEEMKRKEERLEKEMAEVQQQNKQLTEPLQKAKEELAKLKKQLENYEKDKVSLAGAKARLKVSEKEMKDLKWEHEVLEQNFIKVQAERDELYEKFTKAILEVQQKSGFKNLLLERKLNTLSDSLEKKEAQLNEVLSASRLDPVALSVVTRKLEDVLDSKNIAIKDLQYEVARVCKAHNDLLRTCEAKLSSFGVSVEELGFKPLESSIPGHTLGLGPAGLLTTP
ncbi:growth arrest-specific protein 8-like, partial [Scleropages formosus]